MLACLAILAFCWVLLNAICRRPLLQRPVDIGRAEAAFFVLVPPIFPLVFGFQIGIGDPHRRWSTSCWSASIDAVASFRRHTDDEVGRRAHDSIHRARSSRSSCVRSRSCCSSCLFLFLTNEVWQVSQSLVGPFYWIVLGVVPRR